MFKNIIRLFLLTSLILTSLSACAAANKKVVLNQTDIHTDYAGVYITIVAAEDTDDGKILNAVWHNETLKSVTFDNRYTIEYNNGGVWESVLKKDFAVTEIAHVINSQSVYEKSYSTEFFKLSRDGEYRLKVDFYVTESENKVISGESYAIFTVSSLDEK